MNLLTDKAKKDFEKWLEENHGQNSSNPIGEVACGFESTWIYASSIFPYFEPDHYVVQSETLQYALLQEWFDSVGYYIHTDIEQDDEGKMLFKPTVIRNGEVISPPYEVKRSRNESVKWAIECANFKYNQR